MVDILELELPTRPLRSFSAIELVFTYGTQVGSSLTRHVKRKNAIYHLRPFGNNTNRLIREHPASCNGFLKGRDFYQQREPGLHPYIPSKSAELAGLRSPGSHYSGSHFPFILMSNDPRGFLGVEFHNR